MIKSINFDFICVYVVSCHNVRLSVLIFGRIFTFQALVHQMPSDFSPIHYRSCHSHMPCNHLIPLTWASPVSYHCWWPARPPVIHWCPGRPSVGCPHRNLVQPVQSLLTHKTSRSGLSPQAVCQHVCHISFIRWKYVNVISACCATPCGQKSINTGLSKTTSNIYQINVQLICQTVDMASDLMYISQFYLEIFPICY